MMSDEGLNAYGAITWGQFFIYQGFNDHAGWMHTSSGVDVIDEYAETVVRKGDALLYRYGTEERPVTRQTITVPYKTAAGTGEEGLHRLSHPPRPDRARGGRQVDRRAPDAGAAQGADAVVQAHQGEELHGVPRDDGAAHQLVEQHDLRRRRREHRLLPRQLRPEARPEVRLDASRWTAATRPPSGRACTSVDERPTLREPRERLALQHQQLALVGGRGRAARSRADYPGLHGHRRARTRAASTPSRCSTTRRTSRSTRCSPPRTTATCRRSPTQIPRAGQGVGAAPAGDALKAKLAEPIAALRGWDFRWGVDSVPTTLAVFWGEEVGPLDRRRGPRARACRPTTTSATGRTRAEQLLQALATRVRPAHRRLRHVEDAVGRHQPLPAPHRRHRAAVQRRRRRASRSASPRPAGDRSPRSARAPYTGTKKMYGTSGNSFVAVVEFGDRVRARAVTAGGQNGNPTSTALQRPGRAVRDGGPAGGVLLPPAGRGARRAAVQAGEIEVRRQNSEARSQKPEARPAVSCQWVVVGLSRGSDWPLTTDNWPPRTGALQLCPRSALFVGHVDHHGRRRRCRVRPRARQRVVDRAQTEPPLLLRPSVRFVDHPAADPRAGGT